VGMLFRPIPTCVATGSVAPQVVARLFNHYRASSCAHRYDRNLSRRRRPFVRIDREAVVTRIQMGVPMAVRLLEPPHPKIIINITKMGFANWWMPILIYAHQLSITSEGG